MIGEIYDHRCKQNSVKPITEKVCRNNCKHFRYSDKKHKRTCMLGYRKIRAKEGE